MKTTRRRCRPIHTRFIPQQLGFISVQHRHVLADHDAKTVEHRPLLAIGGSNTPFCPPQTAKRALLGLETGPIHPDIAPNRYNAPPYATAAGSTGGALTTEHLSL